MKKQAYSAPKMEQVKMEAEMPVLAGSQTSLKSSVAKLALGDTAIW